MWDFLTCLCSMNLDTGKMEITTHEILKVFFGKKVVSFRSEELKRHRVPKTAGGIYGSPNFPCTAKTILWWPFFSKSICFSISNIGKSAPRFYYWDLLLWFVFLSTTKQHFHLVLYLQSTLLIPEFYQLKKNPEQVSHKILHIKVFQVVSTIERAFISSALINI